MTYKSTNWNHCIDNENIPQIFINLPYLYNTTNSATDVAVIDVVNISQGTIGKFSHQIILFNKKRRHWDKAFTVTPGLYQWSYCSLALSHWYIRCNLISKSIFIVAHRWNNHYLRRLRYIQNLMYVEFYSVKDFCGFLEHRVAILN